MGNLSRRLENLESRQRGSAGSVTAEALRLLSDEDLRALDEAVEEAMERGEGDFRDLFATTQEKGRRALDAYFAAIEAIRRGEEPTESAGNEEARREYDKQDGYRIWKYYRKENGR